MIWDEGLLFVGVSVGEMVIPTALKKKKYRTEDKLDYKTLTCTILAVQQAGGIINIC